MKYKHVFNISVTVESDSGDHRDIDDTQLACVGLRKLANYFDSVIDLDRQHVVTVLQGDQLMGDK